MSAKDRICQLLDENASYFTDIADKIWAKPELGYKEYYAAGLLMDALRENGFEVETELAGIKTAFKGSFGSGKPVIGFMAEYDALAGLSQEAGCTERKEIEVGGHGHGCGHNAMGPACLAAVVALKERMEAEQLGGTIVFYGCPAEEQGCGKSFMTREGVFDDLDAAFAWHACQYNYITEDSLLANIQAEFSFTGLSAHAAMCPELGRSALDAAELMNVGVNFLREHVSSAARIHYAFLDVGGTSPNVVQNSSKLLYYIRSPKSSEVREMYARIVDIAKGAALMTGTTSSHVIRSAMCEYVPNAVLGELTQQCWEEIGLCKYSAESLELAEKMQKALGAKEDAPALMNNMPKPYKLDPGCTPGSNDLGDVSYVVPTSFMFMTATSADTPYHSWNFTAQTGSSITREALIHGGKVMAYAGYKILKNPELAEKAKAELKATGVTYECLIPKEVQPAQ